MGETVMSSSDADGVAAAAQLLHNFNVEYDEPAPHHRNSPPDLRS